MRLVAVILVVLVSQAGVLPADERLSPASLTGSLGACYAPVETFGFKLDKSDPLYDAAREDHQRYLEEMEGYVNCLDRERGAALDELRTSFNLFMENFGKDAVLKYGAEREARE